MLYLWTVIANPQIDDWSDVSVGTGGTVGPPSHHMETEERDEALEQHLLSIETGDGDVDSD